ncbi:MAG: hypothetical protein N2691_04815 [Patescibacteria group bacterium]|nr:hypothetical protein [Patescibacteria group bacterium]
MKTAKRFTLFGIVLILVVVAVTGAVAFLYPRLQSRSARSPLTTAKPADHILAVTQPVFTLTGTIASLSETQITLKVNEADKEIPFQLLKETRYSRLFDPRLQALMGVAPNALPVAAQRSDLQKGMVLRVTSATDMRLAGELQAQEIQLPADIQSISARVASGSGRSFKIIIPQPQNGDVKEHLVQLAADTRILVSKPGIVPGLNPFNVLDDYKTGTASDITTGSLVEIVYKGALTSTIQPKLVIINIPPAPPSQNSLNNSRSAPAAPGAVGSPTPVEAEAPLSVPTVSAVSESNAASPAAATQ